MSLELIYTSAPKGLKPLSSGFCTVAMTQGLPPQLADRLESLSGYRQIFAPQDPQSALNPVVCSHLRISVAGRNYYILSRICAAGLDYSQRTNKFAHHVVLDANELPPAGPAWLLAVPGFMATAWDQTVRLLPPRSRPPSGNAAPAICHRWQQETGNAGWGGAIVDAAMKNPKGLATLIFRPGQDPLSLLAESLALLPPEQRWQATFSTYYTKLPPGVECRWRCVVEGSPEAKIAAGLVIDLTRPMGPPPAGEFVSAARTGQPPAVRKPSRPVAAQSPNDLELARLLGGPDPFAAPPVALGAPGSAIDWPGALSPPPPDLPAGAAGGVTFRRRFRAKESAQWPYAVGLVALALIMSAGGYAVWSGFGAPREEQRPHDTVATHTVEPAGGRAGKDIKPPPVPARPNDGVTSASTSSGASGAAASNGNRSSTVAHQPQQTNGEPKSGEHASGRSEPAQPGPDQGKPNEPKPSKTGTAPPPSPPNPQTGVGAAGPKSSPSVGAGDRGNAAVPVTTPTDTRSAGPPPQRRPLSGFIPPKGISEYVPNSTLGGAGGGPAWDPLGRVDVDDSSEVHLALVGDPKLASGVVFTLEESRPISQGGKARIWHCYCAGSTEQAATFWLGKDNTLAFRWSQSALDDGKFNELRNQLLSVTVLAGEEPPIVVQLRRPLPAPPIRFAMLRAGRDATVPLKAPGIPASAQLRLDIRRPAGPAIRVTPDNALSATVTAKCGKHLSASFNVRLIRTTPPPSDGVELKVVGQYLGVTLDPHEWKDLGMVKGPKCPLLIPNVEQHLKKLGWNGESPAELEKALKELKDKPEPDDSIGKKARVGEIENAQLKLDAKRLFDAMALLAQTGLAYRVWYVAADISGREHEVDVALPDGGKDDGTLNAAPHAGPASH